MLIREAVRKKEGRETQASAMIVDKPIGQEFMRMKDGRKESVVMMVENMSVVASDNLVVDTLGLVVLAKVTAANVQDVYAGKHLLVELSKRP